ncbi:MAG: DUF1385 domain-containing protein [Anaerolineaceae bacterium]|nr:DUF1385 domain-containing protein [Anaerolineaceae bacterium]
MEKKCLPSYGGQALIEGVLMRGKKYLAASFRKPDGTIETVTEELSGIYKTNISKIPLLRGLISLWDSLGLGMKYLSISANMQTGEDEKITPVEMVITMLVAFALAAVLFFVGPAWLGKLLEDKLHLSLWLSNAIEGFFRLAVVLIYMIAVSRMEDIKRVFRYHGAEHKTINCYEAGLEMTVENAKKQSRQHPRCGTAFMVTVVIISVVLFILIGPLTKTLASRLLSRLLLIPVIAGVSYEFIFFTSRHLDNPIVKVLAKPNLLVQNITTAEPDDSMLEVAIKSFETMLALEEGRESTIILEAKSAAA